MPTIITIYVATLASSLTGVAVILCVQALKRWRKVRRKTKYLSELLDEGWSMTPPPCELCDYLDNDDEICMACDLPVRPSRSRRNKCRK